MRKIVLLLLTAMLVRYAGAQPKLLLTDPLEPLFPDSNHLAGYSNQYAIDFPAGTIADVHLLLQAGTGETCTITASLNGKELPLAYWSKLVAVPVEQNTGLDSRTERYKHTINPYVIRRAPFRVYEAIVPVKSAQLVTDNPFTAFRLAIPPGAFNGSGNHKVQITVQGKHWKQTAVFTARVHNKQLPALRNSRFFYTNWFSLSRMEKQYHLERWTKPWFMMLDKYAGLMAAGRQNCIAIPGELITVENGKISLDEEKMYRFIEVFRKYGFRYFESPHLMYRGDNDDWGDPELKLALTKKRYYTAEARKEVDTLVTLIKHFTERYQLTNSWLQHISDEPTKVQAACYRAVVKQVKSIYPEVKIMEATNDKDSLAGSVDLWCPLINDFQENEAFFNKRVALGDKVLVYTCLIPGGKWLNRLLDQERLREVYFGWGAAKYHSFGFLHWGLNQYDADPWLQTVVHHPAPGAGGNNFLPAGDTHIIYPGEEGPLSSVRFEAHRVGIEDYELLTDLAGKDPQKASQLIDSLFCSYTTYNTSVKTYREVRRQLLEAVMK